MISPAPIQFAIEISVSDDVVRLSNSILGQNGTLQGDKARSLIIPFPPQPETSHGERKAAGDQAGIIHQLGINGHGKREAENDDKRDDIEACNSIDQESRCTLHPEPARSDIRSLAEKMRQDGGEVGESGQHDKGPDESVEGGLAAHIDAAEKCGYDGTQDDGVEWIPLLLVDRGEKATEWRGIVASESPEDAAGGQVASEDGNGGRDEREEEETQRASRGAGVLVVDFGEGKEERAG